MADQDLGETFAEVLAERGYAVTLAIDVVDAWLHLSARPPPAVVLIDLAPDRPPVIELFETLRTSPDYAETSVFRFAWKGQPLDGPNPGLTHVCEQPVDLAVLLPTLDAVLGR
jgi:DNA-binding response OmpR family regulator